MRKFHLSDVLTITTGLLVSNRHVDGVYDILNYMTGDNLFTHQLPRAMRACQEPLLRQHPSLREVKPESLGVDESMSKEDRRKAVKKWVRGMVTIYGEELEVEPLKEGEYESMDPISEALNMRSERSEQ